MIVINYYLLKKSPDLSYFFINIKETYLRIGIDNESYSDRLLPFCQSRLAALRADIERYIEIHPQFKTSFAPLPISPEAPEIVMRMGSAAQAANVGPMAAVAGAIAEALAHEINRNRDCNDIIIENGGDIYIKSRKRRVIAVFAGRTRFSYKIGIEMAEDEPARGVCTSSGTTGPSISLGKADAVVIKANTAALADAMATATANRIQTAQDLKPALEFAGRVAGVTGVLAIKDDRLAAWGKMKIVRI